MIDPAEAPKEPPDNQRFVEGDADTIIDLKKKLVWTKQDSWQLSGKWMSWTQVRDYGKELGQKRFAGYGDWRMPTRDEARSLYDKNQENADHMGQKAYLQSIFPKGFGFLCWTSDTRTKIQAIRFNYRRGGITYDDIYRTSRGATRFCRDIQK